MVDSMAVILFDLDGTLTDPREGITRSIRFALEKLGRDVPPADELTWCIGPPLIGSLETLLGNRADAETALALYRERFSEVGLYENAPYPGIRSALIALSGCGHRLFVATSKPAVFAARIIRHFGLSEFFGTVYGSELDGTRADKVELLAHIVQDARIDPASTTMIGDRSHDIVGGRQNGMRTIGVLYGYGNEAELRDAGVDALVRAPDELPSRFRI
jgi:phosphoglycolate phosphatase